MSDIMSEERDPELEKRWDAILTKRCLSVVIASLAACPDYVVGPGQGAEYRLHEPGLKRNPDRPYVEDWVARQQAAAERCQNDQYQRSLRLNQRTYWAAVASVAVGIIAIGVAIAPLLK